MAANIRSFTEDPMPQQHGKDPMYGCTMAIEGQTPELSCVAGKSGKLVSSTGSSRASTSVGFGSPAARASSQCASLYMDVMREPSNRTIDTDLSVETQPSGAICVSSSPQTAPAPVPFDSSSTLRLRMRNSFIDFSDALTLPAEVRSLSAPPSPSRWNLGVPQVLKGQLCYLDELESRAESLSTLKKPSWATKGRSISSAASSVAAWTEETSSIAASSAAFWQAGSALGCEEPAEQECPSIKGAGRGKDSSEAKSLSGRSSNQISTDMLGNLPRRAVAKEQAEDVLHSDGAAGKSGKEYSEIGSSSGLDPADPISTFMLGNLPYRVNAKNIFDALDRMGLKDACQYCYLPNADKRRPRATNLGYAFVKFKSVMHAADFVARFGDFHFSGMASAKRCTLKPASVQR